MSNSETKRPRLPVVLAVVLLVLTGGAAALFGISWATAARSDEVAYAATRDEVLGAGKQAVINFNTLDYRNVDSGLDLLEKSSTGPLREEIVRSRDDLAAAFRKTRSTNTAKILDAALTELNTGKGKARMIAVVELIVSPEGKQPARKRIRYQVDLSRKGDEWKLSKLAPVPVGPGAASS